nr:hypothetical protein [Chitinophagaceae bacterium]
NCDPLLWLKADKGVSLNGNNEVSLWQDQGQLGNHVSMTTATQKPRYKTNQINNEPIVRFDGLNDYMATPTISLTTVNKIEVFYVAKSHKEGFIITHNSDPTTPNAFSIIENSMSGTNGHSAVLNGNGTASASCKTAVTDSCYHTMNVQFDKSLTGLNQVKMFNNQTLLANTNGSVVGSEMTNTLSNAPLYLGGSPLSTLPHFGGDLAELIVYNKILTTAERNQVYTYLNNKYNTNNLSTQFSTGTLNTTFSNEITDDNEWRHAFNSSQPNQVLTSLRSDCLTFDNRVDSVYVEANAIPYGGNYFMRRHFVINPTTEYNGTKRVRLYYSLADFNNLQNYVSTLATHSQLSVIQYDGLNEDGVYDPTGGNITFISSSQITHGTAYGMYYLEFDITHFSEFWIQVGNFPLAIHELRLQVSTANQTHQLSWNCVGCEDVVNFNILESSDDKNYKTVQHISSTKSTYVYKTSVAPSNSSLQYFVVEAEDIDGAKYRSNTNVVTNKNNMFQLQANYSKQSIHIIGNRQHGKIQIYTINGQKILEAEQQISIEKQTLAPGIYFALLVEMGMVQHSIKFVVN